MVRKDLPSLLSELIGRMELPESDEALVRFLELNKVPYFVLAMLRSHGILSVPQSLFERKEQFHQRLLEAYMNIQEKWDREGIRPVFIKSVGHFPSESDNLDILVSRERLDDAISILRGHGLVELKFLREPFKVLLRNFHRGEPFLAIHLHTAIGWITRFIDEKSVLEEATHSDIDPGILVPPHLHQILIHAAHGLYENKNLSLREVFFISMNLRDDFEPERLFLEAKKYGWQEGLEKTLSIIEQLTSPDSLSDERMHGKPKREKIYLPLRFRKVPIKLLHLKQALTTSRTSGFEILSNPIKVAFYTAKVLSGASPRKPVIVALSGPDGCGKTTVAAKISKTLREIQIEPRTVWWRIGSAGIVKQIARLSRQETSNGERKVLPSKGGELRRYIWACLGLLERWMRTWLLWFPIRWRPTVIILDRYVLDDSIDLTRKMDVSPRHLLIRSMLRFFPHPKRTYLLIPSLETLLDRVRDQNEDDIRDSWKRYAEMIKGYPHVEKLPAIVVDADSQLVEVADLILKDLVTSFFDP